MSKRLRSSKNEITIRDLGERAWLRRVRGWFGGAGGAIELGIGDDAAVLRSPGKIVASTDTLVQDNHFRLHTISPRDLGYKALAVNLSDLAAMAAQPVAALLALSVPPKTPLEMLREFFMGVRAAARKFACPLAGGDLTSSPTWQITVTVLGAPASRRMALRSAARAGDFVYATGWPGESGAGLFALENKQAAPPGLLKRHRRPTPRLAEAAVLAEISPRLAMLDVSDGLWNDAQQLAAASGVRIDLSAERLPISASLNRFAQAQRRTPRDFILFGGEDYELLLASPLSSEKLQPLYRKRRGLAPLHCIGRVTPGQGVRLLDGQGKPLQLKDRTFRHF